MATNRRKLIPYTVYASPDELDQMIEHAQRLRLPVAAIIRAGISIANEELRQAALPNDVPERYVANMRTHGRLTRKRTGRAATKKALAV